MNEPAVVSVSAEAAILPEPAGPPLTATAAELLVVGRVLPTFPSSPRTTEEAASASLVKTTDIVLGAPELAAATLHVIVPLGRVLTTRWELWLELLLGVLA